MDGFIIEIRHKQTRNSHNLIVTSGKIMIRANSIHATVALLFSIESDFFEIILAAFPVHRCPPSHCSNLHIIGKVLMAESNNSFLAIYL